MNPDEMETQLVLPPAGPQVPSVEPPQCLEEVMAGLLWAPKSFDPTMQHKKQFKQMLVDRAKPQGASRDKTQKRPPNHMNSPVFLARTR